MKSLFQSIRSGTITKAACESQLLKYKSDKIQLTRDHLSRKLGIDLYTRQLAELNFGIELLASIVEKYDDFRRPLKTNIDTDDNIQLPYNEAFDQVSGIANDVSGGTDDFSTEC